MATLARGIQLSELASVPIPERERQMEALCQDALKPCKEQIKRQKEEIDAKIRQFERQYEMPSSVMRQCLLDGTIKETAEICSWLMLLKLRIRLDAYQNKPPTH